MLNKIILASKSKVRKEILDRNNIYASVEPSNVDEDPIKESLIKMMNSISIMLNSFNIINKVFCKNNTKEK